MRTPLIASLTLALLAANPAIADHDGSTSPGPTDVEYALPYERARAEAGDIPDRRPGDPRPGSRADVAPEPFGAGIEPADRGSASTGDPAHAGASAGGAGGGPRLAAPTRATAPPNSAPPATAAAVPDPSSPWPSIAGTALLVALGIGGGAAAFRRFSRAGS